LLTNAPTFLVDLEDIHLPAGVLSGTTGLTVPIVGADADGDALTITAVSDDPGLSVVIPQGNRFARLTFVDVEENDLSDPNDDVITPIGEIVIELFEQRLPENTERFVTLATTGFDEQGNIDPEAPPFWTDVLVHRVAPGFVFQTGDAENGDGTGGSPLGPFDGVFDQEITGFAAQGVVAWANSGALNTSDSQIFVTWKEALFLNNEGGYAILGQLITGQDVLEVIMGRLSDDPFSAFPADPPVMQSVEIFDAPQLGSMTVRSLPIAAETVLYHTDTPILPDFPVWFFTEEGGNAERTIENNIYTFDTTDDDGIRAAHGYNQLFDPITLDTTGGYTLDFSLRIVEESHSTFDRAGFSIIAIGDDPTESIELGFWEDRIFVYKFDGDAGPGEEDFLHGAEALIDTTIARDYTLRVEDGRYTLFADGTEILDDVLKDYTGSRPPPAPYDVPNSFVFGDATSRASAISEITSFIFRDSVIASEFDGLAGVTVTLDDGTGHIVEQTINVIEMGDRPYINDVPFDTVVIDPGALHTFPVLIIDDYDQPIDIDISTEQEGVEVGIERIEDSSYFNVSITVPDESLLFDVTITAIESEIVGVESVEPTTAMFSVSTIGLPPQIVGPTQIDLAPGGFTSINYTITDDLDADLTVTVDTEAEGPQVTIEALNFLDMYQFTVDLPPDEHFYFVSTIEASETAVADGDPRVTQEVVISTIGQRPTIADVESQFVGLGETISFFAEIEDDSNAPLTVTVETGEQNVIAQIDPETFEVTIELPPDEFVHFDVKISAIETAGEDLLAATTMSFTVSTLGNRPVIKDTGPVLIERTDEPVTFTPIIIDDGDGHLDVDEDLDGDGNLDVAEDVDGDGNLDVDEDVDGDGNLDVDEDIDGDGILDVDEDIDGDGNLDVDEDIDGDGNLDVAEDVDGDGKLDLVDEDVDGDGQLDFDEDVDGDGNLDVDEDVDGDGTLDLVDEDVDVDGNLDINEDVDGDGNLDVAEDVDGDGKLDLVDEDLNGDGLLNDGLAAALLDEATDGVDYNSDGDQLDMVNEDADGDGNLDINEDLDGDGNLDVDEDTDGDGTLDLVDEDLDGDGNLDVAEDIDGDGHLDVDEDVDSNTPLALGVSASNQSVNVEIDSDTYEVTITLPTDDLFVFDLTVTAVEGGFPTLTPTSRTFLVATAEHAVLTDATEKTYTSFVDGDRMYVANGLAGMRIYDISNLDAPMLLGTFDDISPADPVVDVVVQDSVAYLADFNAGVLAIDVSDPANPMPLDSQVFPGAASKVLMHPDHPNVLFVAAGASGLASIDISDPSNLAAIQLFDNQGTGEKIADAIWITINDQFIFVSDRDDGIKVVDVSDPADMEHVNSFYRDKVVRGTAIHDDLLYITDPDRGNLLAFDVSKASDQELVGSFDIGSVPTRVAFSGSIAVVAQNTGYSFFDAPLPETMVFISSLQSPKRGMQPLIMGDHIILPIRDSGGIVYINTPNLPQHTVVTRKETIIDSNGVEVTISISGGGYAVAHTSGIGGGDILQLDIFDTTIRSKVKITTDGGETTLFGVFSSGPLKSFIAKTTDLDGTFSTNVFCRKIEIDDALAGSVFQVGYSPYPKDTLSLFLDEAHDTTVRSIVPINKLYATSMTTSPDSDARISTDSIKRLKIDTDFEMLVGLNGGTARRTLNKVHIRGDLRRATFNVTGDTGTFKVDGVVEDSTINILGGLRSLKLGDVVSATIEVDDMLRSARFRRVQSAQITADEIRKIKTTGNKAMAMPGDFTADVTARVLKSATIRGDLVNSTINLTQQVVADKPSTKAMSRLKVTGFIADSLLRSAGHLGTLTFGGMRNATIHAAVAGDFDSDLPSVLDDFYDTATISKLRVKGIDGEPFAMINTNIAAWIQKNVKLVGVQLANGGEPFGLSAHEVVKLTQPDLDDGDDPFGGGGVGNDSVILLV